MLSFDHASRQPLTSDALIQQRAAQLVGRAVQRQLWLMFLDDHDYQLPLLVPLEDMPENPPDWQLPLGDFADEVGASAMFVVLERYGSEALTPADVAWARHIRECCVAASVDLRGILLSHRRGVRWVAPDDYLF